jgi:hypothetical protein
MRKNDYDCAEKIVQRFNFTAFATITFRQDRCLNDGHVVRIDRQIAEETCGAIRDRVFKKLKCRFRWLTTIENGSGEKKIHAHLAIELPAHVAFEEFQEVFLDMCSRMDWVNERYEIVRVTDQDGESGNRKVIFYILKEGVDAIAVSASTFQVLSTGR